jgi:hypothetical protein
MTAMRLVGGLALSCAVSFDDTAVGKHGMGRSGSESRVHVTLGLVLYPRCFCWRPASERFRATARRSCRHLARIEWGVSFAGG